jgi:hypothetical protein
MKTCGGVEENFQSVVNVGFRCWLDLHTQATIPLGKSVWYTLYGRHTDRSAKAVPLHATKIHGGGEVQLLLIHDLGTRLGWVISVTPRPRFNPGERTPPYNHCTGSWVYPRAGLDTEARGNILCLCRGSNVNRPVVHPVVRHYTDWATRLTRHRDGRWLLWRNKYSRWQYFGILSRVVSWSWPTFQKCLLPPSWGHLPDGGGTKHLWHAGSTRLHGSVSHKSVIFVLAAVGTCQASKREPVSL